MPIANKIAGIAFAAAFFAGTAALATPELNNAVAQAVSTVSNTSKVVTSQTKNVEQMYKIAKSFMTGNPDIRRGMNILGSTFGQADIMSIMQDKGQNLVSKKILFSLMKKIVAKMAISGSFSFNIQQLTSNLLSSGPFLDLKTSAATVAGASDAGGAAGRAFPSSVEKLGQVNVAFAEDEAKKEATPPLNAVTLEMDKYAPLAHCSVKAATNGQGGDFSSVHNAIFNNLAYDPRSPKRWKTTGDNLNQSHALINSWGFARAVGVIEYLRNWKTNNPQLVEFSDTNAKSVQAHDAVIIAQASEMFKMANVNRLLADIRQEIEGMNEMMSLSARWGEENSSDGKKESVKQ